MELGRLDVGLVDGARHDGVHGAGVGGYGRDFEGAESHAPGFGRGAAGFDFHLLVAHHINQVEAFGQGVFGPIDEVPMHIEFQRFAIVGGNFLAAVDDGSAEIEEFGLGEGLEYEFVADAVGVAVGDGDAELLVHCVGGWESGGGMGD